MKQGRTVDDLLLEIDRQRHLKADYIVDTREMSFAFSPDGDARHILRIGSTESGSTESLLVKELAHQQIAEHVGIPGRYYNRMRDTAPDLLSDNVNHWFSHQYSRRMIRTLDGYTRAFLSDRYRRLDNEDLMEAVLPALRQFSGIEIKSCEVTETRLYLKVVTEQLAVEISVGDIVYGGVVVSNSEVGKGALKIEPMIYRLVCKNGMIVPDYGLRKYHIGGRLAYEEEYIAKLSDETIAADDHAFWLKVRDVLKATLSEDVFGTIINRMKLAQEDKITADPIQAVERLSKRQGFSLEEQRAVVSNLLGYEEMTRLGLSNAVTRTSQVVANYDRATELEYAGSDILVMPDAEWRDIAKVATY